MKKILLLIFAFISFNALAQIKVKEGSFKRIPKTQIEDKEEYVDGNDSPMALIKISMENIESKEIERLVFSGNRATQILKEPKSDQMWIYLSAEEATFIDIKHPDYGVFKYMLPETLCDYCVYEMLLQYIPIAPVIEVVPEPVAAIEQKAHLVVKADHGDALIYIDNEPISTKEASRLFDIGSTHTWKIECDMYHTDSGAVTIKTRTVIDKKLRPAFGYISVTTSPEQGAKVFVDEKYVGVSPCKTDRLPSGDHVVKVMKDMYKMSEKTIVVTDNQTINAALSMEPNFINVTITTDPLADIYVDEAYKGKGSWNGRMSEGNHYLEARKTNHKTTSKNISLVLGANQSIKLDNPKPINGSFEITSEPMGAYIYIDGKTYGETPNYIPELLIGNHELRLVKPGCDELKKTITIQEGATLTLNETLITGKMIKITTYKHGDKIYIDNKYVGTSPMKTNLSYGAHNIKAERKGKTVSKFFNVSKNGDSKVGLWLYDKIDWDPYVTSVQLGSCAGNWMVNAIVDYYFWHDIDISVGGELGWVSSSYYGNRLYANARADIHYEFIYDFDTYASFRLGFVGKSFNIGVGAGGRYYISDIFGLNAEFLLGRFSNISIGISVRLGEI